MFVPYFSQFESKELTQHFIERTADPASDPLWERSGATDTQEYARWAGHLCGMACLKMYLAAVQKTTVPLFDLAKACQAHGGYKVTADDRIKGLFYKECVQFLTQDFKLDAKIVVGLPAADLPAFIAEGLFLMASVHPSIRDPISAPPKQGGHLVLVFANSSENNAITFHNPSGFQPVTQERVTMKIPEFARFYAGRGIAIKA